MHEVAADAALHEPTRQFVRRLYELRAGHRQALRIYNGSADAETSASRFLAAITQEPTEALARLQQTFLREHEATLQQLRQRARRQETSITLGALSALVLLALFILWFVDRNFATPMTQAIETAKQVAAGKVDERLHSHSSGEFGAFAQAFNFMLDRLARANSELQDANRELEAFSYSVSHDLRAPLRAMDGFSQALAEDYGHTLDATGRDYLERVRNGARNMGLLIDDLLKLSRITRASLQPADVNLTAMAREIAANLRNSEPHRDVRIDIAEGLHCQGDPGLVRIVLENLLGNAWKYTSKTPQACISFDTESHAGETVYRVRDNGAGFDMKFAGNLFGAFQRLHQKAEFEGSGIGLATVARIVHRHRGRVWAEAEPRKGACFNFTLGAAAPASLDPI